MRQAGTVTRQLAQGGLLGNIEQNISYEYSNRTTPVQGNNQGQTLRCHPDWLQADVVQSMHEFKHAGSLLHPAHKA